ncbi:MAG: HEAT repeat domain-containing protein [Sandaracinaceae bacterium]|nr:HEAT repeat domain-containing protein [Sandaracinaceae bacterium]
MPHTDLLHRIFDADRTARDAEEELLGEPSDELAPQLVGAVEEALALDDDEEAELRLRRLADLCAQVPGPKMADTLLKILDHPEPTIRAEAGEALLDVAFERFKEVARAVERALDRDHQGLSMQELPFVLTEIRDPDPLPLVARFLSHPDATVVAAGIEAMAAYGDPGAAKYLEPMLEDEREATLEDVDEGPTQIGELAAAALEELGIEV